MFKGLFQLFIVKDSAEAALALPRTYGVDDIPVIIQSKAFDILYQIAIASDIDTALFVNGTLNSYFNAPAQVVRFRLLNGSSHRFFYFSMNDNRNFKVIAGDESLLDAPVTVNKLILIIIYL